MRLKNEKSKPGVTDGNDWGFTGLILIKSHVTCINVKINCFRFSKLEKSFLEAVSTRRSYRFSMKATWWTLQTRQREFLSSPALKIEKLEAEQLESSCLTELSKRNRALRSSAWGGMSLKPTSSAFWELRDDENFFHITIACDDEQLSAHKLFFSSMQTLLAQHPAL